MSNLQFRNANADDSEKLTALINSAYRGDQSRKGWTTEADILDGQRIDPPSVRELIAQPEAVLLMAFDGEDLVGSVFLEKKETDKAYLGMLTVKPDIQAKGTGREILLAAEEWVQKSWDVSRVEMTVIQKRAELIAWYERRGYCRTGEIKPFPYGNELFGIPKVKDLEFIVLQKELIPRKGEDEG